MGASAVVALDVDPTATKVARRAIKSNGLRDKIKLARGTLPHKSAPAGAFDLALANISSKVVVDLAQEIYGCLTTGGRLVAGGFLDRQEHDVVDRLTDVGFVLQRRRAIEDWVTLVWSKA